MASSRAFIYPRTEAAARSMPVLVKHAGSIRCQQYSLEDLPSTLVAVFGAGSSRLSALAS
jgi:hypothetical protein